MSDNHVKQSGVNPEDVPSVTLASGAKIPALGLGTFGSDRYSGAQIADAVKDAASLGYRHFDCASVYRNEAEIGNALRSVTGDLGVPRHELWITSKVWNDCHDRVEQACRQSMRDLQVDYLDLYLVHWPFPNYHAPGVGVDARDPHAVPYIHEQYMRTWRQMEHLQKSGMVRHIGTSNMTIAKLQLLLRDAEIPPAVNEMELHPHFQQPDLYQFVTSHNIVPVGYSPIGSPSRPARDRTPEDTVDMEDPVIVAIADRLGVHPAVVCVKWAVQRGHVAIPFSVKRSQYLATLQGVTGEPLTQQEMEAIAGLDKNNRLIKGQVFLWPGSTSWEDLWDIDGHIKSVSA